jgi:lipopolysaccharide/colanic/teichoic acid biosynthesis glycosyltransferase
MSFDAPLLPPSLIPDYESGLNPEPDKAINGLVSSGFHGFWQSRRGDDPPAISRDGWPLYGQSKRLIDILASSLLIVALFPLFPAIAVLVKATTPGPIIFRQRRFGYSGRIFWCYKFRTMVADAEEQLEQNAELSERFRENSKIKADPRVTRLGWLLRRTSLDELPQLFNVLRGDISLIGPRPLLMVERVKYGVNTPKLFSVKPGLSGYWQVYGRSDTTYEQRIAMDMSYIDNRSLWLDLKLMVLTAFVVLRGRGAY